MELVSPRLVLSEFDSDDALFILGLLNDPDFIRFIGDKKVRNLTEAEGYIANGPRKSYSENGFGLWKVSKKNEGISIGMCGLIRRESLPYIDIGYAYLPEYRSQGYALEAAKVCVEFAKTVLKLDHLCGITDPDNHRSIQILSKLGMKFSMKVKMPGSETDTNLYLMTLTS